MIRLVTLLVALIGLSMPALAVQPDEILADPGLEQRARDISGELRCMVCQNQSIDDSDAELARDLRLLVRERLTEGDSDGEVFDYVVARYGEFVLLRPVFEPHTLVLWGAAPVLLILGLGAIALSVRNRRRTVSGPGEPLTDEEKAALESLSGRPRGATSAD